MSPRQWPRTCMRSWRVLLGNCGHRRCCHRSSLSVYSGIVCTVSMITVVVSELCATAPCTALYMFRPLTLAHHPCQVVRVVFGLESQHRQEPHIDLLEGSMAHLDLQVLPCWWPLRMLHAGRVSGPQSAARSTSRIVPNVR